jgi:hypothetical protein
MRRLAFVSTFLAAVASSLVACQLLSGIDNLSKVESLDGGADSSPPSTAEEGGVDSSIDSSVADGGADSITDSSAVDSGSDSSTDSSGPDSGVDSSADSSAADSGIDSSGSTSIVRVQAVSPGWVSSNDTTLTLVEENAGDLLVAGVYFAEATATITVTDTLGNSWLPTNAYANTTACNIGNVSVAEIFYAGGIASGDNVVTVTQSSGTSPLGAYLVEYSGVRTTGPLDGVSGGSAASSTATMSAGNLTTTSARDLVVALFAEATAYGIMTTGPGFSVVDNDTTFYSMFEDDLPTGFGPGTIAPTANEPGGTPSDCWVATAAAFHVGP